MRAASSGMPGKDHLFWHIGRSTPLTILCPTLGQIQLSVHKSMTCLACVRQEDAQLAVLDPAGSSTVLSLHPHRFLPFLEKPAFINDQHAIGIGNHLTHRGLELISHLIALPHRPVKPRTAWRMASTILP